MKVNQSSRGIKVRFRNDSKNITNNKNTLSNTNFSLLVIAIADKNLTWTYFKKENIISYPAFCRMTKEDMFTVATVF